MSATNWQLPPSARGVLFEADMEEPLSAQEMDEILYAHDAERAHPHRTDDAVLGITFLSLLVLPLLVRDALRRNQHTSRHAVRSFLRTR